MLANGSSNREQMRWAVAELAGASREAQRDAAVLLCHVLGKDRAWMLAHTDDEVSPDQVNAYRALVARRALYEPMQYILGEQEFYGLCFCVTPAVLIPRPETEHLVEAVLSRVPSDRPLRIADIGTGSGAIAITLARHLPLASAAALYLSQDSLHIAQRNAEELGVADRVRFLHSDLLEAVSAERFACLVSNPPYVSSNETLESQVAQWEPHSALFAGPTGMDIYERLLPQALAVLEPGGLLALEIGYGQSKPIADLLALDERWSRPEFVADLQGIARVALARLN